MSSAPRDNGARQLLSAMRVPTATRFAPLVGLGIGAFGGGVYWLAAEFWPSSVALVLCILASALLTNEMRAVAAATRFDVLGQVFYVLIKYNVLMALSAAKLPLAAAPNTALWLIMICGYGASRALLVCTLTNRDASSATPLPLLDLAVALVIGFAPALLLGLPGLIALATAVLSVLAFMGYSKLAGDSAPRTGMLLISWIAELSFYLGALASWSYV